MRNNWCVPFFVIGTEYVKIMAFPDEDHCFIGSCLELFYRGCHGRNEREVFDHLCQVMEEMINLYKQYGKPLPQPLSSREVVNALQRAAKQFIPCETIIVS